MSLDDPDKNRLVQAVHKMRVEKNSTLFTMPIIQKEELESLQKLVNFQKKFVDFGGKINTHITSLDKNGKMSIEEVCNYNIRQ